jgi:tetraacyldisaccharide 4'-kinase
MQVESARHSGNERSRPEFADQGRKTMLRTHCNSAAGSFADAAAGLLSLRESETDWQDAGIADVNESWFRDLVSGKINGVAASCARAGLSFASVGYRIAVGLRNGLFDLGLKPTFRSTVPVISIGNITTGGTGKTPLVALVCQMLLQADQHPGIVSRGYRSVDGNANDEKLVLEILCPDTPHKQDPDRVAAATFLTSQPNSAKGQRVNVIVMDDGFQHRRLHRDLNIVLIDATNPFGHGYLLPRGLLREPLSSLKRADVVIITRSDLVSETALTKIEEAVIAAAPKLTDCILRVVFEPTSLRRRDGSLMQLNDAAAMNVHLMAGIGNPEAFQSTAVQAGMHTTGTSWFPDHHHYSDADLDYVLQQAESSKGALVVTTLKDLVKLPTRCDNLAALEIAAVFPDTRHLELLRTLLLNSVGRSG